MDEVQTAIENLELNIRWIEDVTEHQFPGWKNVTLAMQDALELLKMRKPKLDGTGKMMVLAVKRWLDNLPFPTDVPIMAIGYCLNLLLEIVDLGTEETNEN